MKLYKLTDENDCTHGGCKWEPGKPVVTDGTGELCGPGYTHWYTDPLLAVLLNPLHGQYILATAHLWEGEGEVARGDHGLKVGCITARVVARVSMPVVTTEQRIRFGILCSLKVAPETGWGAAYRTWAQGWLVGTDRSYAAAYAAYAAAFPAYAAADAAYAAAHAADAAGAAGLDLVALAHQAVEV